MLKLSPPMIRIVGSVRGVFEDNQRGKRATLDITYMLSITLRVVGLVLGFIVGLRISTAKFPPIGPTEPSIYTPPDHSLRDVDVMIASVAVGILFKILNYFFTDDENAGIGEYIAGLTGGVILGIFIFKIIPTIFHWVF